MGRDAAAPDRLDSARDRPGDGTLRRRTRGGRGVQWRVELVPARDRSRAALDAAAGEVWDQPLVAEVPLRAAHAAELMGLLGREGDVDVLEHGSWQRLACPGGSVAVRRGTGARLDLFAL